MVRGLGARWLRVKRRHCRTRCRWSRYSRSVPDSGPAGDIADLFRRSAPDYVDRILRGAKVNELPVQFSTKFELVINMKTAKAISLTIPESFLLRADEVIE